MKEVTKSHLNQRRRQFLAFIVGFLTTFPFLPNELPGILYLGEAALLIYVIFRYTAIKENTLRNQKEFKSLALLSILWLVSILLTDTFRGIATNNSLKSIALLAFFLIDILGIWYLAKNNMSIVVSFVIGRYLSLATLTLVAPNGISAVYPWKFGFGGAFTIAVVLLYCLLRKKIPFASSLLLFASIVNLSLGARILAALSLLTFFLVNSRLRHRTECLQFFGSLSRLMIPLLLITQSFFLLSNFVSSDQDLNKTQIQSSGSFGLIVGGRSEIVFSLVSIRESPFFGTGSGSHSDLEPDKLATGAEIFKELGYTTNFDLLVGRKSFTHSHLFQNWIQFGLISTFFWFYVFYLCIRSLGCIQVSKSYFGPIVTYAAVSMLWNILFSPFGSFMRIENAIWIAMLLVSQQNCANHSTRPLYR